MVKVKIGNILDAKEDIICHQVNVQGIMGGGVAKQLASKYKLLEENYRFCCEMHLFDYELLKNSIYYFVTGKNIIANLFTQKENFDTDYESMEKCFIHLKNLAINTKRSIAMPYKIGCGIAHGDWNIVYKIIKKVFCDCDVTLYKLEG